MAKEISETAITIDHDTGDVFIDTRSKAFEGMCRRAGLTPNGDPRRGEYVRFKTMVAQVDVIIRRHHARRPSAEVIQRGREVLETLRAARAASTKTAQEA